MKDQNIELPPPAQSIPYVGDVWTREQINAAIEPYAKRIAELEAARIAYASEFKPDENGEPDVGSIHENIRMLKADRKRRGEPVKHPSYDTDCCQGHEPESICKCAAHDAVEPVKVPDHLIERLKKHCEDKSNTAFARSSMREAIQYLSDQTTIEPVKVPSKPEGENYG
ncbi:hypothetical protein PT7_P023 (plasmid) [Pusillimonas sp. T7-7]|uniref:hypothetical protein n=1 Tax=Pusillimonas sp. (strain T7-7) TaxID=1007105 RepID=UPI0002084A8E|nr:hypothetical protein [Pusillimonas sp. T7-7]AEC22259.1 hypothetical protein PT7_P023 [Pusillimonas sp. T7-7]